MDTRMKYEFDNINVREEHQRWTSLAGPADPYFAKDTIGIHEVLQAHFLLIDFFQAIGEGVGGVGPRDINLLHSALSRQFVEFGGKSKWSKPVNVCSTLMFGLIKNHPFYDANKRTAFLVAMLHLQKIGRTPKVDGEIFEDFIVDIADNSLNRYEFYQAIDAPYPDKEILTISQFLKKNTRLIDLRSRTITYRELNTLLRPRGMELKNPKGNRIDLIRNVDSDGVTMLKKPLRVAHIGFHGWTKQVSIKDINIVGKASKLDARHGYDSQSFYFGMEDPLTLIQKYRQPLERLAFR